MTVLASIPEKALTALFNPKTISQEIEMGVSSMTRLVALGDQAILTYFAEESDAAQFAESVRRSAEPWIVDVVQAYASVAVYYDSERVDFAAAADALRRKVSESLPNAETQGRQHVIPCCYEMGPDLAHVAKTKGLTVEEVIRLHTSIEFTVYAIGFCPGFPYLGYLPPELSGVPRLASPRVRVEVGSVGLTGRQTGIYTEPRPGGWNLIARTPLTLVDVADGYFPLRTADRVRFERIDETTFRARSGERL
jgi:inhibitor of KinA